MIEKCVDVTFEPFLLETLFQKRLKLQIAFYRNGKVSKTQPMKFINPTEPINMKQTLNLSTTLQYNQQSKLFSNKDVDMQVAIDIDGNKLIIQRKINIKDYINNDGKNMKFILAEEPFILLHYRIKISIKQIPGANELKVQIDKPKQKKIRFQNEDQGHETQSPLRKQKSRSKTTLINQKPLESQKNNDIRSQQYKTKLVHTKSLDKIIEVSQKQNQSQKISQFKKIEANLKNVKQKNTLIEANLKQTQSKYNQSVKTNKNLEKKIKQKDEKIEQLDIKFKQLQKKVMNDAKIMKQCKEQLKRQQNLKCKFEQQITVLKEQNRNYKLEIQKLSKNVIIVQQSSKNILTGNQQQLKSLKDKIRQLQKHLNENKKQNFQYDDLLNDKDEIIKDLKGKISLLDRENAQLIQTVKNLDNKLFRKKQEYEGEILDLNNRIAQYKQQQKILKLPTSKQIGTENIVDLKKKIQNLEKKLENKEQLIKKLMQIKKQSTADKQNQNANLKKQITALKDTIQKLEQSKNNNALNGGIEYKIQAQKMKKQLENSRKNEKALLIQKSQLEQRNKALQDDVIKGKQAIANILNSVQQTGNEKLISDVYNLIE